MSRVSYRLFNGDLDEKSVVTQICGNTACINPKHQQKLDKRPHYPAYNPHGPVKYSCNHNFFDLIDTEEKAYWLGFIAADGAIVGNQLTITLSSQDRGHLETLRQSLKSTHPIKIYEKTTGNMSRLVINSKQMKISLSKYGLVGRKTLTVPWPDLPNEMLRHYLRGYVDGDGCFTGSSFNYIANEQFAKESQRWLAKQCDLNLVGPYRIKSKNSQMFRVLYGGKSQISRIAIFLYKNSGIRLERKLVKAIEVSGVQID